MDGFIDGPNGEFDWPPMGPQLSAYSDGQDRRVDTLLFGRPVWQMMVGFWPTAESVSDDPHVAAFAPFWRVKPKIVFSRTYPGDDWTSRVITGNLAEEVAALKARPGGADMLLTGGAALAASLTELGLIDEYHIAVHPVVLGGGRHCLRARSTATTCDWSTRKRSTVRLWSRITNSLPGDGGAG